MWFASLQLLLTAAITLAGSTSFLPELVTKQSSANLRFISEDGKYTYYQDRSGQLLLSTNYSVTTVIKGSAGDQYEVLASPARKKLLIIQRNNFFRVNSALETPNIYVGDFGKSISRAITNGLNARLHQNDEWLSYYKPKSKTLIFQSLIDGSRDFEVKLRNPVNPYFIPQAVLIGGRVVLFTDLNVSGHTGIARYNADTQKTDLLYKTDRPGIKVELLRDGDTLIIGKFPQTRESHESSIEILTISNPEKFTLESAKKIYSSPLCDPGNMKFTANHKKIWFIKDVSENKSVATTKTEAASVNITSGDVVIESDLSGVTQIVNMDGHILLPYRGQLFSVTGKTDLKTNVLENPLVKIKKKTGDKDSAVTKAIPAAKNKITGNEDDEIDEGNDEEEGDDETDEEESSSQALNTKKAGRKTVVEKLKSAPMPKPSNTPTPAPANKPKGPKRPNVTEKQVDEEDEDE
jgi:hypothetical protein